MDRCEPEPPEPGAADEVVGEEVVDVGVDEVCEGEFEDDDEPELDVRLELDKEVSEEDVVRGVVADEVEGVAVDAVWVERREAGVVEPRKVQTSSGPSGIWSRETLSASYP